MPKNTKIRRNPDLVTVYHRSYSEAAPHTGILGRKAPTTDYPIASAISEEDTRKGLIGNLNMSDTANDFMKKGLFSGLGFSGSESTEGNRYRDDRGFLIDPVHDKTMHARDVIFTGGRGTVSSSHLSDRPFIHRYSIPRSSISSEIWGDDDFGKSDISPPVSPQHHIPLRRGAVLQSGVVHQMINSFEGSRDSMNYVIPIPNMEHLGVQFKGTRFKREAVDEDYFPKPRKTSVKRRT